MCMVLKQKSGVGHSSCSHGFYNLVLETDMETDHYNVV